MKTHNVSQAFESVSDTWGRGAMPVGRNKTGNEGVDQPSLRMQPCQSQASIHFVDKWVVPTYGVEGRCWLVFGIGVGGLFAVMAAAVAALIYNKPLSHGLAGFIGHGWPPGGLIREDRPNKIEEQRQIYRSSLVMARFMVLLMAMLALVGCIAGLIHGPS
jgi:hypothetical protein